MRRYLLVAIFAVLSAFSILPGAAHAAINCKPKTPIYPESLIMVCPNGNQDLSDTADGTYRALTNPPGELTVTVMNSVSNSFKSYITALHTKTPKYGVFYVFNSADDYKLYAPSHGLVVLPDSEIYETFGITLKDAKANPLYSIIFANIESKTHVLVPSVLSANTAAHEIGHWFDSLFAATAKTTALAGVSSTTYYSQEVNADYNHLNSAYVPCGTTPVNGMFTYRADDTWYPTGPGVPAYICNGSGGGYPGLTPKYTPKPPKPALTNKGILNLAWELFSTNLELFSETYAGAVDLAAKDDSRARPASFDIYFGYVNPDQFQCSRHFIKLLVTKNQLPITGMTPSDWPTGCPTFAKSK